MDLTRREFVAASVAPVMITGSGCIGKEDEELESFYFDSDLNKAPIDIDGEDIYVNLRSFAEGQGLEENRIEYQEPGDRVWSVLDAEDVQGTETAVAESYTTDEPGEYRFRSVVEADEERYVSETEVVEFVEDIENDFL